MLRKNRPKWNFAQKPEGKGPLARPRRRWEDNIKMDLEELGCEGYGLGRAGLK